MKRRIFTACMALAAVALLVIAVVLPGCDSDEAAAEPEMKTTRFQLSSFEGREVTKVGKLEQYAFGPYNLEAAGIYLVDDELPTTSLQVQIHGMARPIGSGEKDAPDFEDFPYKADVVFEMVQERDDDIG